MHCWHWGAHAQEVPDDWRTIRVPQFAQAGTTRSDLNGTDVRMETREQHWMLPEATSATEETEADERYSLSRI